MNDAVDVGRVVGLWRYPVKSMGAEVLPEADISWDGVVGDRRWAFIRDANSHNGFPWLTLRDRADMASYRPLLVDPGRPDTSPTTVQTPSGVDYDVTDPALAEELWVDGARAIRQGRGTFDTFPLSLITTQTIARIGELIGHQLDALRFRPNVLVEATAGLPFVEDQWVGRMLRLGSVRMRVDKRDGRCVVINIDPTTARRDPTVLRTVATERDGCLGVYGSTVTPGRVAVNDPVLLEGGA
ncbi:MAG: MOSC domain-containing protein [Chloroflexi bacterium]|nr:MOSC domain-containing protein [Chloroflexota bacterium]